MIDADKKPPNWVLLERCAALFAVEHLGRLDTTVVPNATITGTISGKPRQIDVLVDARWSTAVESRIIIDAKDRKRKLDIKDVESFEGMMKDCGAPRGILVTPAGWTSGAERRAQDAITMTLMTVDQLDDFSFTFEPCRYDGCQARDQRRRRGAVLWEEFVPSGFDAGWIIAQMGNCDGCHSLASTHDARYKIEPIMARPNGIEKSQRTLVRNAPTMTR